MDPYHAIDEEKQPDDQQQQQYYDDGPYQDDGQGQYYDQQQQHDGAYDPAYDAQPQDGYGNDQQQPYDDQQQQPYDDGQHHPADQYHDDQQQQQYDQQQGGYDDPNQPQQQQQQYDDGYDQNAGYDDQGQHYDDQQQQQLHDGGYDDQQQHQQGGYDDHNNGGHYDQNGGGYDQNDGGYDDGGYVDDQQQQPQQVAVEGPSLAMVYRWMVSSIGEAMAGQSMTMSLRISMPLDAIQEVAAGISLREPGEDAQTELFKNLWIAAHTRHFHGVIVLAWAKLQQADTCNPECCPKMIVGKTEVRWKQSAEELAAYEDGDPYKVTYLSLPASEYIDRALSENHGVLSEETITPFVGGQASPDIMDHEFAFSAYFIPTMKEVYKYMLRVYTHLYLFHIDSLPATFAGFLAPPPDHSTPALPTAQIPLERFSFHLSYFLHFGLSYHLLTHAQIDSLGNAMKYFIWNLPDMVDQVPQSFRDMMAKGEFQGVAGAPGAAVGAAGAAGQASSNPFLQSTSAGSSSSAAAPGSVVLGSDGKPFRTPDGMYMIMGPNGAAMLVANLPADATASASASSSSSGSSNETPKEREERAAAAKLAEENKKLSLELEKLKLQSAERERERNNVGVDAFISPAMAASSSNGASGASSAVFTTPKPGAPSNIDPALINLKRTELIKKSIAPFIAHNLAIAKVEQDLRESNFPANYVPSPGYGANGYLLPTGIKKQASSATLLPAASSSSSGSTGRGSPQIHGMDNSPKILSPSSRERNKSVTEKSSASKNRAAAADTADDDGPSSRNSKSASKSATKGGKASRRSGGEEPSVSGNSTRSRSSKSEDGSDSEGSEGTESRESSKSANSSSAKHSRPGAKDTAASASPPPPAAETKEKEEPAKKAPIPRRPIQNRQPPQGREPSCGQRLCF